MGNIYIGGSSGGTSLVQNINTTPSNVAGWGYITKVDATTSTIIVNLPSSVGKVGQNIAITKVDNSINFVKIVPYGTETINGLSSIYLYNNSDAITIFSDGANCYTLNDNRSSIGSTASFARFIKNVPQTSANGGIVADSTVIFNSTDTLQGSGISIDTSTGIITLKSGRTFSLKGSTGSGKLSGSNAYVSCIWRYSTDNGTTWNNIGLLGLIMSPSNTTWDTPGDEIARATITTASQTLVKLSITTATGVNAIGSISDFPAIATLPWCEIEEQSRQATVINTMDYISAYQSATQSISTANTILNINTKTEGNMVLNGDGTVNLIGGKTYTLIGGVGITVSADFEICFRDVTNSKNIQVNSQHLSTGQNGTISAHYTPSSNCKVGLSASYVSTTGTEGIISSPRQLTAWFTITQVGSTATTSVPISLISGITEWTDASSLVSIGVISGTAPTKATASTINARYKVIGKSLYFDYVYSSDNNTGSASGTGIYTINIASVLSAIGASINTTLAPIDTNATGGTILYPKTAPVGNGTMALNDGTNYNGGSLGVHIASATSLCMHGTEWNGSNGIATGWVSNVFYSITSQKRYVGFKCIIPLT